MIDSLTIASAEVAAEQSLRMDFLRESHMSFVSRLAPSCRQTFGDFDMVKVTA